MLRHNYIGTEHILLGLLREQEGLAAGVLESLGITLERTREQVNRIVGSGEEPTAGQIPFTPRAKRVLELALREALSLGHNNIGTEHVLLGLARENEGVAARILLDFGADSERIRTQVIQALAGSPKAPRVEIVGPRVYPDEPRELLDESWFGGLSAVLSELQFAIKPQLGRMPDSGDLLLAFAAAPGTRAEAALRELGVELDALAAALERARAVDGPTRAELARRLGEVRADRERAARAQEYENAADLRDEERRLARDLGDAAVTPDVVTGIWMRLGLSPPEGSSGRRGSH